MIRDNIRNIAIIAHVDHGKTTLVDCMLKQSGIFRSNEHIDERVMDNNDIEKERGITILAKNTSIRYKGYKINIIDTPGHADFGGEVERTLSMVDGVLLLVDALEGCMPQTRYVLKKALELDKQAVVVVNKVDREGARPLEAVNEVMELFLELGAKDSQFDFSIVYTSAKLGFASLDPTTFGKDMQPLFDTIIKAVPAPQGDANDGLQAIVCNIDYDEYVGRIGIGKIVRGRISEAQTAVLCHRDGSNVPVKVTRLYQFEGLKRQEVESAEMGDIVAISGVEGINIGDTICDITKIEPLPFVNIDEPTLSMIFMVNNSPFAGREGKFVTSRHIRARLFKEMETNVSLRVEETNSADSFKVYGRGELHLSILIENMRREGYEFQVARPKVIYKTINGALCEPMEQLVIDVPDAYVGAVINKIGPRKGEMVNMTTDHRGSTRLVFNIPSRGIIGYRNELLTDTKGNGVLNHLFIGYEAYKGDIPARTRGSLVVFEDGMTTNYGLFNAQERCRLFIEAGLNVYTGMVVGENSRDEDLVVNVCKKKHLTNNRASGSDDALKLITPTTLSLEQCLEFIAEDELVEITPTSIRLRKKILNKDLRMKTSKRSEEEE